MKISLNLFLFGFLLIACVAHSQNYPVGTKYVVTTVATEYDHGDSVKQQITVAYYDSAWSAIAQQGNTLPGKSSEVRNVVTVNTAEKNETCYINAEGDTTQRIVYLYDDRGNRTYYFQIKKKDTLNNQKRVYDSNGNNTELYNKVNGRYVLFMEFSYNSDKKCIHKRQFNLATGVVVSEDKHEFDTIKHTDKWYQSTNGGKFELKMVTTELSDSVKRSEFYYTGEGYNCGIKLAREKGGYSITEEFDTGSIERLEIYDKKGRKSATVYVTYITL